MEKGSCRGEKFFLSLLRGCFIISVKSQVGVFLFKLHIVKREHSGGYVTEAKR